MHSVADIDGNVLRINWVEATLRIGAALVECVLQCIEVWNAASAKHDNLTVEPSAFYWTLGDIR